MKTYTGTLSVLLAGALLFGGCKKENTNGANDPNNANNEVAETLPAVQTAVTADVNANIGGFYKALPARYDSTTKKYPGCHQ